MTCPYQMEVILGHQISVNLRKVNPCPVRIWPLPHPNRVFRAPDWATAGSPAACGASCGSSAAGCRAACGARRPGRSRDAENSSRTQRSIIVTSRVKVEVEEVEDGKVFFDNKALHLLLLLLLHLSFEKNQGYHSFVVK